MSTVDAGVGVVCRQGDAIPTPILQRASVNLKCLSYESGGTHTSAYGDTLADTWETGYLPLGESRDINSREHPLQPLLAGGQGNTNRVHLSRMLTEQLHTE